MKKLIIKIIGVLLLISFLIYLFYSPRLKFDVLENPNKHTTKVTQKKDFNQADQAGENDKPDNGVATWIGQDLKKLTGKFGQAKRTYAYQGGFENYVFTGKDQYYLVTTKANKIKSVYATGEDARVAPVKILDKGSKVYETFSINPEPAIKLGDQRYEFELSDPDLKTQPLIKLDDIYAQVYIDQQTDEIVGVRYLDKEALAAFKPYQMLSEDGETQDDADKAAVPYDQNANQLMTLYDITNEMRKLKREKPLTVNNELAHIASFNLYEANDNEHVEFTEEALKQQLNDKEINFVSTGQNVGYDFTEVPTLIHSWLNSDMHRSRLLNPKYNEMGGEVSDGYFTLIFIEQK